MKVDSNYTIEQQQIARIAKALGHPVRIAILQLLQSRTCCYHGDMADELPIAKSTLSQHLNELKDAGLIQGTITPPSVKYCIHPQNWETASVLLSKLLSPSHVTESCEIDDNNCSQYYEHQ